MLASLRFYNNLGQFFWGTIIQWSGYPVKMSPLGEAKGELILILMKIFQKLCRKE